MEKVEKAKIERLRDKQCPFAVAAFVDEDFSGYRAFLIDIPAVESLGATPKEALRGLDDAKAGWFAYDCRLGLPRRPK